MRLTDLVGQTAYLFQASHCACTTAPKRHTDRGTHWTAYAYTLCVGMMHALFAPTQKDRMSDGQKRKGEQQAGTEIERVFQCHKIIFIENNPMFPCWYSHANTPTAFCPLTECLGKGDKSFHSELASGKRGPGRESVQGSHGDGEGGVSRWCGKNGF